MEETKIQVGTIVFIEPQEPALPSVPVAVAVARCIGRPVQCAEVVPLPRPERLCWAQFEPISRPDPFLPVPLADFSEPLWAELRKWGKHFMRWSPRADQRNWGSIGLEIIESLSRFLNGFQELVPAEARWLRETLRRCYAQPQGAPELLAADTAMNRARRQAAREKELAALQVARLRARQPPPSLYTVPGDRDGIVECRYRR